MRLWKHCQETEKVVYKKLQRNPGRPNSLNPEHEQHIQQIVEKDSQLCADDIILSRKSQFEDLKISKSQMNHHLRNNKLISIKKSIFDPMIRDSDNNLQTRYDWYMKWKGSDLRGKEQRAGDIIIEEPTIEYDGVEESTAIENNKSVAKGATTAHIVRSIKNRRASHFYFMTEEAEGPSEPYIPVRNENHPVSSDVAEYTSVVDAATLYFPHKNKGNTGLQTLLCPSRFPTSKRNMVRCSSPFDTLSFESDRGHFSVSTIQPFRSSYHTAKRYVIQSVFLILQNAVASAPNGLSFLGFGKLSISVARSVCEGNGLTQILILDYTQWLLKHDV
ncbi:hypothetical protein G6F57_008056 [Rhizopus arrhizus]|uniref:Uncharacterized protein n=1 Tax=Rhizopus oryzae TaxID=64495 RepID=A0A9P7BPD0_RHIOR|nr:hypothetical protein G6F30_007619 [Rhizopus arrhizus]KAG0992802.1 hypothetical protein G6F28_007292 [Rhizopus arrhizus]KAG1005331.1 hypothetical protein G6F27_009319 [Rhizopus arrhizus]KAG1022322.1 hypothetical protein G6F26_007728 [Rhizopus arrhizus]KAG1036964.1 hypothetical protein G6F25_007580 [Rhizopus arrhizus]